MLEDKLGDKCPACGVDSKFFAPYTPAVSERRLMILKFHLHPIMVHFPTSFSVAILLCLLLALFPLPDAILATGRILATVLPAVVALAIVLGILDGILRFRRIKVSQILKKKIPYGLTLLAVSLIMAFTVWQEGTMYVWFSIILAVLSVALTTVLGLLGSSINESILPGK
jgi:uncharacterized membrane protein